VGVLSLKSTPDSRGSVMSAKSLWTPVLILAASIVVGSLAAPRMWQRRRQPYELITNPARPVPPVLWDAPAFRFVDQDGRSLSSEDLRGSVWIADFIFASCAGVCPAMSARMSKLQKEIGDPKVKFISFSVDPDHDTPEVLRGYGHGYGADGIRWRFLSTTKPAIYDVAAGMKLVAKPAEREDPILHSDRFVLIDQQGHVRGTYVSSDDEAMGKLLGDALYLANVH